MSKQYDAQKDLVQSTDLPAVGLTPVEEKPYNSLATLKQTQQNVENIGKMAQSVQNTVMKMEDVDRQIALQDHQEAVYIEAQQFNAVNEIKTMQFHMDMANQVNDISLQVNDKLNEFKQQVLTDKTGKLKLTDMSNNLMNETLSGLEGTKYQTSFMKERLTPVFAAHMDDAFKTDFGISQTRRLIGIEKNLNVTADMMQKGTLPFEAGIQQMATEISTSGLDYKSTEIAYNNTYGTLVLSKVNALLELGTIEAGAQAKEFLYNNSGYSLKNKDGSTIDFQLSQDQYTAIDKEIDSHIASAQRHLPKAADLFKDYKTNFGGTDSATTSMINGMTFNNLQEKKAEMINMANSLAGNPAEFTKATNTVNEITMNMDAIKLSSMAVNAVPVEQIPVIMKQIQLGLSSGMAYKEGAYIPVPTMTGGVVKLYPSEIALKDGSVNNDYVNRYYAKMTDVLEKAYNNLKNPYINKSDTLASVNQPFNMLVAEAKQSLMNATSSQEAPEHKRFLDTFNKYATTEEKIQNNHGFYGKSVMFNSSVVDAVVSGYQNQKSVGDKQSYALNVYNALAVSGRENEFVAQLGAKYGKNGKFPEPIKALIGTMVVGNNQGYLGVLQSYNDKELEYSTSNKDVLAYLGMKQSDIDETVQNSAKFKEIMGSSQISGPYKALLRDTAEDIAKGLMLSPESKKNSSTFETNFESVLNTLMDSHFKNLTVKDGKGVSINTYIPNKFVKSNEQYKVVSALANNMTKQISDRATSIYSVVDKMNYSPTSVRVTVVGDKLQFYAKSKNPLNGVPSGREDTINVITPSGEKYDIGIDLKQANNVPKNYTPQKWGEALAYHQTAVLSASQKYEFLLSKKGKTPAENIQMEEARKTLSVLTEEDFTDKLRNNPSNLQALGEKLDLKTLTFANDADFPSEFRKVEVGGRSIYVSKNSQWVEDNQKWAASQKINTNKLGSGDGGGGGGATGSFTGNPITDFMSNFALHQYVSPQKVQWGTMQDFSVEMSQLSNRPRDLVSHLNKSFGTNLTLSSLERHDGSSHDPAKNQFMAYDVSNFAGASYQQKINAFKSLINDPTTKNIMTRDKDIHAAFASNPKLIPLAKVQAWDTAHKQDHGTHWHVQTTEPWRLKANLGGYNKNVVLDMIDTEVKIANNRKNTLTIPASLIKAVAQVESGFNVNAKSGAGAVGLMQMMPSTFKGLNNPGADINDPELNLRTGILYLQRLYTMFDGDMEKALAAYNTGPTTVKTKGITKDGRQYIDKVMKAYSLFNRYSS